MSFRTALTGLNAASADLGVISNNIANNNTTGFKMSRAEFGDIYSLSDLGTSTRRSIGTGVKLNAVAQQFKQGNLETTTNPLDLAIDGEGFFQLREGDATGPTGATVYTRAGAFGIDSEGFIVNSQGLQLQGYQRNPTTGQIDKGDIGSIQKDTSDSKPTQTTKGEFGVNLNSSLPALDPTAFDFQDSRTYNYATAMTIFDSTGSNYSLTAYFVRDQNAMVSTSTTVPVAPSYKIADPPGGTAAWQVFFSVDGKQMDGTDFGNAVPAGGYLPAGLITFDAYGSATGAFNNTAAAQPPVFTYANSKSITLPDIAATKPASTTPFDPDYAAPETPINGSNGGVVIKFDTATQFGSASSTNQASQDGYASGRIVGVDVGEDGTISGRYSNGQAKILGQVILVNFANVQGLSPIGDTSWVQTSASGQPVIGPPGTASLGLVRAGALELSNVELSEQLVKMISAQRNFQANAQVISTADQMTQTLLNMR